ncbi:MAG: serine/threonine protein phosphatase [Acutalibacteraceae bacterium]
MILLDKLFKSKKESTVGITAVPGTYYKHPFSMLNNYMPLQKAELDLYAGLREAIPIIDAALSKIVRLVGTFEVRCRDTRAEKELKQFLKTVKVNGVGMGISSFITSYLDQLLTYGTAVGEMVIDKSTLDLVALYNADLNDVELKYDGNPLNVYVCRRDVYTSVKALPNQQLILKSVLNPEPGQVYGTSLLKGLPFVSSILLKIFNTIGTNWERVGNIRYAVTYKPSDGNGDRQYTRERAKLIADEWTKAMHDKTHVSDFVSIGDVSIKVIGADNQILESEVPVRHMLEQIVAKLGVPPFLLGLSWASTERMSSNQTDILTSELEYYRELLNPAISKICSLWLRLNGYSEQHDIAWSNINLQDEVELANARLINAQAKQLENELGD